MKSLQWELGTDQETLLVATIHLDRTLSIKNGPFLRELSYQISDFISYCQARGPGITLYCQVQLKHCEFSTSSYPT